MTRPNTDHLRLVALDDDLPEIATAPSAFITDWTTLCHSFSKSSGLELTFRAPDEPLPAKPEKALWFREVPAVGPFAPGHLSIVNKKPRTSAARVAAGQELAEHIGSLVADLHAAHRTLWQREAELATAIPLIVRPDEEQNYLATRFEGILRSGAEAIDCHASAMYILDDATHHLKVRSHWGLCHSRFIDPPRPLRHARADVEALAGHAITISDASEFAEWDVPESCSAAICVPISTMTVPLGTLWVFSEIKREFTDREVNLIETIAGRLSVELEREILLREQGVVGTTSQMTEAITWQQDLLPGAAPDIGDWQLAARPSSRSRLHGDYYRWQVAENGDLSLTMTTSHESGVPAALTAATISGLLQHRPMAAAEDAAATLSQINTALFSTSTGDRHVSAFSGSIATSHGPHDGTLQFAAAGNIDAFIIRPHGWETIVQPGGQPVGSWDPGGSNSAQAEFDTEFGAKDAQTLCGANRVEPGDVLLVLSGKPRRRPRLLADAEQDGAYYAEALLHHPHLSAEEMTTLLASLWEHDRSVWGMPPAILIAKHRG